MQKNTSQVIGKTQCPRCASKGNDNSKDNLVLYADKGRTLFCLWLYQAINNL